MTVNGQRKIEMLATTDLIPYANNARTHSEEQIEKICRSIEEFGFINPVLIDEKQMIVAGHGRVMAAKKLGMDKVPCLRITGLTETQIRAYILADNKLAEDAGWDDEILKVELDELIDLDFDITIAGFDFEQDDTPEEIVEDEIPEEVPTISKLGDLWILGDHRLICGDSTDVKVIDKLMKNQKADLLLTDPPYGIDYGGMLKGKGDGKGGSDKNGWKSYDAPAWDEQRPDKGVFDYILTLADEAIIWGGNYFSDYLEPKMCWLVWDKGQRDFSLADGELAWTSFDKALRIKTYSRASANKENKVHPTQKPIELLRWCIHDVAERNMGKVEKVLDCFGGSGSTLITCEQLHKKCFMVELDPKYCDIIIQRWENLTGKKAVLENG